MFETNREPERQGPKGTAVVLDKVLSATENPGNVWRCSRFRLPPDPPRPFGGTDGFIYHKMPHERFLSLSANVSAGVFGPSGMPAILEPGKPTANVGSNHGGPQREGRGKVLFLDN